MRVLVLPELHTSKRLGAISTVNLLQDVFRGMSKLEPCHFHWIVPKKGWKDYDWDESIWEGTSFTLHEVEEFVHPYLATEYVVPDQTLRLLDQAKSDVFFDVAINGRTFAAPILKKALECGSVKARCPQPVVNWISTPPIPSREKWYEFPEWYRQQIFASSTMDGIAFFSEYEKEQFVQEARTWLSPARVSLLSKRVVAPFCIRTEEFAQKFVGWEAERKARREKTGRWNVFYGGALVGFKRPKEVAEICAGLKKRGIPVDCVMTTPAKNVKKFQEMGVTIKGDCDRRDFLNAVGSGDILLCLSGVEGSGTAFFEAAASGMVAIFKDEEWLKCWMPPKDKYPLVGKNLKECEELVLWAVRHWDEAKKLSDWFRLEWLPKVMGPEGAGRKLQTFLRGIVSEFQRDFFKPTGSIAKLVKEGLEDGGSTEVKLTDLFKKMQAKSMGQIEFWRRADVVTKAWIRRTAQGFGYEDTCESGEVVLRRSDASKSVGERDRSGRVEEVHR